VSIMSRAFLGAKHVADPLTEAYRTLYAAGVLGIWLLVNASRGAGSNGLPGLFSYQATVGFGAYFNLIAAVGVVAGGFLKARDEHPLGGRPANRKWPAPRR
jgi:hypothetical protein